MFDLNRQLGIKSYSFRKITENADVADAIKQCGVDGVDLSGCHVSYDDAASQKAAVASFREAGVRITGIGVVGMKNDARFNRRYFDFARQAGCGVISCSFEPHEHEKTLTLLDHLCGEYEMRVAIHNHGGKNWLGNSTILRYLIEKCGSAVGICLDTAWCLQAGEDPVAWLDLFGDRLYAVHFKDFIFDQKGRYHDTIVGEGALDLSGFLRKFSALPFDGSAVIEYEGDNPIAPSAECVQAIRRELESLSSRIPAKI